MGAILSPTSALLFVCGLKAVESLLSSSSPVFSLQLSIIQLQTCLFPFVTHCGRPWLLSQLRQTASIINTLGCVFQKEMVAGAPL